MAHFMRVFCRTQEAPTIPHLVDKIEHIGFELKIFPAKDDPRYQDPDWKTVHLSYEDRRPSVMVDRSISGAEDFAEEIDEFRTAMQSVEGQDEGRAVVEKLLSETEQIIACMIPDDFTEEGWELVEYLLELLLDATDGTLQADGEGFFDKEGELIFAID